MAHGTGKLIANIAVLLTRTQPTRGRKPRRRALCRCRRSGDEPRWKGFDFNEKIHLCECCNAHVLRSGSKFSVWFCDSCLHHIDGFNAYYGRTIVPIGRHSIMFKGGPAVGRRRKNKSDEQWAERASVVIGDLGGAIDVLIEHRHRELPLQMHDVGLRRNKDVTLHVYIERLTRRQPSYTSLLAFDRLSRHFAGRSLSNSGGRLSRTEEANDRIGRRATPRRTARLNRHPLRRTS